jgi:hypothetical protein
MTLEQAVAYPLEDPTANAAPLTKGIPTPEPPWRWLKYRDLHPRLECAV